MMCKGKPPGPIVQTWQAGQTIKVQFEGSAKHGGVNTYNMQLKINA